MTMKHPKHLALVAAVLPAWLCAASMAQEFQPRPHFDVALEPKRGVLHGVGQSKLFSHVLLRRKLPADRRPAFHMVYCGIDKTPKELRERFWKWNHQFSQLPADVGMNLGLSFANGRDAEHDRATDVLAGKYDDTLIRIAKAIAALQRPVWVRIGYECNGFWNGYRPETYRPAFRHIAKILRAHGAGRVATLWCVHPINDLERIMRYYPGDKWVDWWSIDLFQPRFCRKPVVRQFCQAALKHKRPVFIGESTPAKVNATGQEMWDAWFEPYFELIGAEPAIKAFSYIHRDWGLTRWRWGNARIVDDPVLLRRYTREMGKDRYVHSRQPEPVEWHVLPLEIDAPVDNQARWIIQPGKPATITVDLSGFDKPVRYAEIRYVYQLTDADARPLEDVRATLTATQGDTHLDANGLKARDRRDDAGLLCTPRFRPRPASRLTLTLEAPEAIRCRLDGPETPDGYPPYLMLAEEKQPPAEAQTP